MRRWPSSCRLTPGRNLEAEIMTQKQSCTVLDENITYDLQELCTLCRVKDELVHNMISEGILTPIGDSPGAWKFSAVSVKKIQITVRLQQDLRVNLPGAALALDLMEELEELRPLTRERCFLGGRRDYIQQNGKKV